MSHPETEVVISISRNFSLQDGYVGLEDLHKALSEVICQMLIKDYPKLLNLLYRIDVNERKFQEVFREGTSEQVSGKISTLIIERELEKANWRRKYK
jgi:hypothetical protein